MSFAEMRSSEEVKKWQRNNDVARKQNAARASNTRRLSPSTLSAMSTKKSTVPLYDVVGFPVPMLVDDLLDIGADATGKATEALESYLNEQYLPGLPEEKHEQVLAGLVSFQTLLESHLDKAFDGFEHWSLRNVFAFDPELDIVLEHQKGLDLTVTAEQESKLVGDIEELRQKVQAVSEASQPVLRVT